MQKQNPKTESEMIHQAMVGLLPWYVNGRLSITEADSVEQHLRVCSDCRSQVQQLEALTELTGSETPAWKPSAAHLANIMADIDKLQSGQERRPGTQEKTTMLGKLIDWVVQTPVPVRWVLGIESAVFAVLALVLLLPTGFRVDTPDFETLSNIAPTTTSLRGTLIKLMFNADMNLQELTDLLKQADAQLREGPSPAGVFTVEVAEEQSETAMSLFRNHPKIRLSEVVVAPQLP